MDELKKIQLNDEPKQTGNELQSQGGRLRLPPTGKSGKDYHNSTGIVAAGEYSSGQYKWQVSVSANVSIDVHYVWEEVLQDFVFENATIAVTNVVATFIGTTQGSPQSGVTYTSLSHYPSVPPSGGTNITQSMIAPVTVSAGNYELKGFHTIYNNDGEIISQGELETFNAAISIRVEYGSTPYGGVFGISADLN